MQKRREVQIALIVAEYPAIKRSVFQRQRKYKTVMFLLTTKKRKKITILAFLSFPRIEKSNESTKPK